MYPDTHKGLYEPSESEVPGPTELLRATKNQDGSQPWVKACERHLRIVGNPYLAKGDYRETVWGSLGEWSAILP
jgi:hypothetical protein